jgi:hypothetical protein
MLRAIVVALLVANLAFFAWTLGWLDGVVGVRARGDREPERLALQVRPESVTVLKPGAKGTLAATAPACLEAGPFAPADLGAAEAALQGAGIASGWVDMRSEKNGTWLLYMGSYPDREVLLRKIEEIRRVGAPFEEVSVPAEGPFGLSLGRFDERAAADRALAQAQQRGIRTSRVIQLAAPSTTHLLRFDRIDPATALRLAGLKNDALGKGFVACATNEAAR